MKDNNTKATDFVPTQRMVDLLKAAMNFEGKMTISGMCKEAGLDRKYWYVWWEKPGFREWWNEALAKHFEKSIWLLDKISFARAVKDYRYMEMLQMKYGKFRRQADVTSDNKSVRVILGDTNADPNTD